MCGWFPSLVTYAAITSLTLLYPAALWWSPAALPWSQELRSELFSLYESLFASTSSLDLPQLGTRLLSLLNTGANAVAAPLSSTSTNTAEFHVAVFLLLAGLCHYCYLMCMFTDPGAVPSNSPGKVPRFQTSKSHQGDLVLVDGLESKNNGCRRWCRKCRVYKPDRTHHCSSCNRCVLRMDHHCIFINCCVGMNNHKYFVLFLFYAITALSWSAATLFMSGFYGKTQNVGFSFFLRSRRAGLSVTYFVCFLISAVVALALMMFSLFQMFLFTKNFTTIEYMEKSGSRKHGKKPANMYDIGALRNMCYFLGHPLLWLIPLPPANTSSSQGRWFAVRKDRVASCMLPQGPTCDS